MVLEHTNKVLKIRKNKTKQKKSSSDRTPSLLPQRPTKLPKNICTHFLNNIYTFLHTYVCMFMCVLLHLYCHRAHKQIRH